MQEKPPFFYSAPASLCLTVVLSLLVHFCIFARVPLCVVFTLILFYQWKYRLHVFACTHTFEMFSRTAFCSTLKTFVCKRTASPSVTTNTTTCLKHFNLLYKDWLQEKCDSTTLSGLVSYVLFCKIHLQYKHMASLQKKCTDLWRTITTAYIMCQLYIYSIVTKCHVISCILVIKVVVLWSFNPLIFPVSSPWRTSCCLLQTSKLQRNAKRKMLKDV